MFPNTNQNNRIAGLRARKSGRPGREFLGWEQQPLHPHTLSVCAPTQRPEAIVMPRSVAKSQIPAFNCTRESVSAGLLTGQLPVAGLGSMWVRSVCVMYLALPLFCWFNSNSWSRFCFIHWWTRFGCLGSLIHIFSLTNLEETKRSGMNLMVSF